MAEAESPVPTFDDSDDACGGHVHMDEHLARALGLPWPPFWAELARIYQAEGYEAAEEWLCRSPR